MTMGTPVLASMAACPGRFSRRCRRRSCFGARKLQHRAEKQASQARILLLVLCIRSQNPVQGRKRFAVIDAWFLTVTLDY